MFFSTTKKIILIMGLLILTNNVYCNVYNSSQLFMQVNALPDKHLIMVIYGFLGTSLGIVLITKGILDAYNIPITYHENVVLALRSFMSKDDYKKHEIGNKIKYYLEIFGGTILLITGSLLTSIGIAESPKINTVPQ